MKKINSMAKARKLFRDNQNRNIRIEIMIEWYKRFENLIINGREVN